MIILLVTDHDEEGNTRALRVTSHAKRVEIFFTLTVISC